MLNRSKLWLLTFAGFVLAPNLGLSSGRTISQPKAPDETKNKSTSLTISEEFILSSRTIEVQACHTEVNVDPNGWYRAYGWFTKSVRDEVLTIIRDRATGEVLAKDQSVRVRSVKETFPSEHQTGQVSESQAYFPKLNTRCEAAKRAAELEMREMEGKDKLKD